jgi:hypothetical protein
MNVKRICLKCKCKEKWKGLAKKKSYGMLESIRMKPSLPQVMKKHYTTRLNGWVICVSSLRPLDKSFYASAS